jgi:hypothetical protein
LSLEAGRPGLSIENEDILFILETVIVILPINILETVDQIVMDDRLLRPKSLGNWQIFLIDILDVIVTILLIILKDKAHTGILTASFLIISSEDEDLIVIERCPSTATQ